MKSEDKDKIKDVILKVAESGTHSSLMQLTMQMCEAVDYIDRFDNILVSGSSPKED